MSKNTVYRKCGCGETAHDYKGQHTPMLQGRFTETDMGGWPIYECRNCGAHVVSRGVRAQAARSVYLRIKAASVAQ